MPYTDWIELMETAIPNKKELSIIEFGLGEGTEYLIKNFKDVYSYELMNTRNWYDYTVEKLSLNENWQHKLVLWSEIGFKDYDTSLPQRLLEDIDTLFSEKKYDVVFMDGGYHVRGDIVNVIINKFYPDYIVIHDINYAYEIDGYGRINLPKGYRTEKNTIGEGTMIFIKEK
jgi:hypothetical protein